MNSERGRELEAAFTRRRAAGESVALARRTDAPGEFGLLIFAGGQFQGDLGEPRLNQRAALYAEAILEKSSNQRAARQRKSFEGPQGLLELEFDFERS